MKPLTNITTDWDDRYNTNLYAEPTEWRHVETVLAIHIVSGHLRGLNRPGF